MGALLITYINIFRKFIGKDHFEIVMIFDGITVFRQILKKGV